MHIKEFCLATVLLRTTIIYIILISAMRLTGKRQIGELQITELIITFMISELATVPIQDLSIPIAYSLFPIVLLLCYEVIVSFLITKSKVLKKIFAGNPTILIKKGKLDQKELAKSRIGINEFLGELRLKDISDISQVDYAVLEQNGQLSVFLKSENQPVTLTDLKIEQVNQGISHAIIVDGEINESNLKCSQKNLKWLNKYLDTHKLNKDDIFLFTVNDTNDINIIMKDKK